MHIIVYLKVKKALLHRKLRLTLMNKLDLSKLFYFYISSFMFENEMRKRNIVILTIQFYMLPL